MRAKYIVMRGRSCGCALAASWRHYAKSPPARPTSKVARSSRRRESESRSRKSFNGSVRIHLDYSGDYNRGLQLLGFDMRRRRDDE